MTTKRRKRGYRILEAFFSGETCPVCGQPYDPYRNVVSNPKTKKLKNGDTELYWGFKHEGC